MKYIVFLMVLFALSACNRFDNTFETKQDEEIIQFNEFVDNFISILQQRLLENEVEIIMGFYAPDYLNDGMAYQDIKLFWKGIANESSDALEVELISRSFPEKKIEFHLNDSEAGIDIQMTDYVRIIDEKILLIGNRHDGEEVQFRKVLVELFTATWCSGCPYVESALYDLKQQYPDYFYYIEYHMNDPLDIGNADIYNYYSILPLPTSIIQGSSKLEGGSTDSYALYKTVIESYFGQEKVADLILNDYAMENNTVTGSIEFFIDNTLSLENLKLKYALLDKVSDVTNHAGVNCRNVVLARAQTAIHAYEGIYSFSIEPQADYSDMKLIFWVQRVDVPYDQETSLVYDVFEFDI